MFAAISLAAAVVALPSSGVAQKPAKTPKPSKTPTPPPYDPAATLTLAASPNPVTFPKPVTLSGRLRSGRRGVRIAVLGKPARTTTFKAVGTATTANNGRWSLGHRPTVNTTYRATAATTPPVRSADVLVKVRMLVGFRVSDSTPRRGALVRFSGIVRPRHNGRRALIQRRSPTGRWVTVARPRLRTQDAQTSRYSRRLRVRRTARHRVRVLGHSDHAQGISRERTLTVH